MDKKDLLKREFLKGKVSRRDFNAGLMSMGLTAAAAGAFVSQTTKEAEAAEPVQGGYMRVACGSSHAGDTLDPAKIVGDIDITRSGLLYNRLIDFLPGQDLVGNLATSWEPNGDATVWTIELMDGVEFHNGKTMTAADVAYSFNRHLDPEIGSPANAYLGDVESIVADGDKVVVFNMKSSNADIPYLLSEYHFTVQPEGQDADAYAAGTAVGTGPWMVQEFDPGITAVFERNPNYHRTGRPYIDEIETFGIPDNASRVNALLAGEVEIMIDLDAQLIAEVEAADNAMVLNQPGGAHPTYPMLADVDPYTDNNVRWPANSTGSTGSVMRTTRSNASTASGGAASTAQRPTARGDNSACGRLPFVCGWCCVAASRCSVAPRPSVSRSRRPRPPRTATPAVPTCANLLPRFRRGARSTPTGSKRDWRWRVARRRHSG
jgi:peptide/nickel transport system substrate-binding protein